MQNERWSSGAIRDQSGENLLPIWIFTLLWNIVTALAIIPHVKEGIHGHDRSRLLALVFPAIGLGLLVWAARRTRRITKFGASIFHLRTLPATPGGDLAGTIHVARAFQAQSGIQLQLVCMIRFVVGFGRRARVIDRVIWREAQTFDRLSPCHDGTDIPVLFRIPPDAKPSSDLHLGDGVRWRLQARCKTAGVSYYSRFEVPVFVVNPPTSAPARARDPVAFPTSTEPSDPRRNLSERGIICEQLTGGRLRIHFAAARNRSFVILITAIGSSLNTAAVGLAVWPGLPIDRILTMYIASIIFFVGALFDFIAIFNWLVTDEINARYGSLTVERRGPLFLKQQTFKIAEISDIFPRPEGGSSSTSAKEKKTYGLTVKTRDGDSTWLVGDIFQKDYAAWLADEIKDTLGLVAPQ